MFPRQIPIHQEIEHFFSQFYFVRYGTYQPVVCTGTVYAYSEHLLKQMIQEGSEREIYGSIDLDRAIIPTTRIEELAFLFPFSKRLIMLRSA